MLPERWLQTYWCTNKQEWLDMCTRSRGTRRGMWHGFISWCGCLPAAVLLTLLTHAASPTWHEVKWNRGSSQVSHQHETCVICFQMEQRVWSSLFLHRFCGSRWPRREKRKLLQSLQLVFANLLPIRRIICLKSLMFLNLDWIFFHLRLIVVVVLSSLVTSGIGYEL